MLTGKVLKPTAFLILLFSMYETQLPAQTVYVSNLANGPSYGLAFYNTQWFAQPFTTGTNPSGYEFDSAHLSLGAQGTPPAYSVSLYSNGSNVPGSVYSPLTTSDNLNFTPASSISLAPTTTYWLVMSSTAPYSPSSYNYTYITFSSSYSSSDGWTVPFHMFGSNDSGSSWSDAGSPALFSVTALETVPEPSTFLLVGLGFAALFFVRTRRYA